MLVSSGGVSKPASAVYLFLNLAANGIMDAKISGENELRRRPPRLTSPRPESWQLTPPRYTTTLAPYGRLYAAPGVAAKGVGYTVVRPGGLTRDAPLGVSAVELNQGDTKSGRIARCLGELQPVARSYMATAEILSSLWQLLLPYMATPPPLYGRSDVAAICIESLASAAAFDTTFECYYGDTAKSLDEVIGSLLPSLPPSFLTCSPPHVLTCVLR